MPEEAIPLKEEEIKHLEKYAASCPVDVLRLIATVRKLQSEIVKLEMAATCLGKCWQDEGAKAEKYRIALAFYADSYTWVSHSGKVGVNPIDHDCENIPTDRARSRWCGGKKAREALK